MGKPIAARRRTVLAALLLLAQLGVTSICAIPTAVRNGEPGQSCAGDCLPIALEAAEVERIVAQGVAEAQRLGVAASLAVVDHVGNVLAVYEMTGARHLTRIGIFRQKPDVSGVGLEGTRVPAALAAISKAGTAAYLSSQGNAFSTRSASQIVQEHFNPGERFRPGGPLFGVQFSQLPCGDLVRREPPVGPPNGLGPKRLPLGLAADPGGLPLYIWGVAVGGVGVEFDNHYDLDAKITDTDADLEERIAAAASQGFAPPRARRAERIAVDGRYLRFADDEGFAPAPAPPLAALPAAPVAVPGFFDGTLRAGTLHQTPASGIAAALFEGILAEVLVEADGSERFPPTDSALPGGPSAAEVRVLLREALLVAESARAQIRQPSGSKARVTVSVVDLSGSVLGIVRSFDAPIFGIDVSLQKARTAAFLSSATAAADLVAAGTNAQGVAIGSYVTAARSFLGDPTALTGRFALSDRAVGNLARPFFPDGVDGRAAGPFSRPFASWSPFAPGLQLDLVLDALAAVLGGGSPASCTAGSLAALANGIQIFPGSVPIYRGDVLVGAIGVSGDGVDQDDLVAFLGLHRAGRALGGALGNAPRGRRADQISVQGVRLRYVSCPAAPFLDSSAQSVCEGL